MEKILGIGINIKYYTRP